MDRRKLHVTSSRVLLALLCIAFFAAVPGFAASSVVPNVTPLFSDFDGDHKVDHAELFSNGALKHIHISLGNFRAQALFFDSGVQEHGQLLSDDIDSDGDADLVWISQSQPRKLVLWLGDGRGNFSIATATDAAHLQKLLSHYINPQLASDGDDCESTGVLQTRTILELDLVSSIAPVLCCRRSSLLLTAAGDWTACLSVLRKRGPPSVSS
jgi:hypothetical protein